MLIGQFDDLTADGIDFGRATSEHILQYGRLVLGVVGVSACYSGGWIEPLQGEDTLVMTAADKDHTSYGCGALSELTFFGRAMFDEGLRETRSFEKAFAAAVPLIQQREIEAGKDDGFSNPQISVGASFRAHWDHVVQTSLDGAVESSTEMPDAAPTGQAK